MAEIQAFTMRAKPGQTDAFFQDIGEGVKILAAMGGSVAGTNLRQLFGGGGSGDLVAAGRGASLGQALASKYMAELPQSLQASRIGIVLQNEVLLKLALKTGRTQREKNALAAQLAQAFINNYIVSPVRRGGGEALQTVTEETTNDRCGTVIPSADVPTVRGGNAPTTVTPSVAPVPAPIPNSAPGVPSGVTPIVPNTQQNPSRISAPAPISSSGPVDRARFAALFPEDRDLMGIGSLMQGTA